MNGRSYQVHFFDGISNCYSIDSGVPQGAPLSPLIFAICMKNVITNKLNCKYYKYADDLITIHSHSMLNNVCNEVADMIQAVDMQIQATGMTINQEKTKVMLIPKNNSSANYPDIMYNNNCIKPSKCLTLLGVSFNRMNTWTDHFNNICKRCRSRLYILRKLKGFF